MSPRDSPEPVGRNDTPAPWARYVAIGDSFTEGIGDPEPRVPGGFRGWADRVAEVLAERRDDLAYANLAIRGRLLQQILDEQVEPALALTPDLVTISAGGNDIIRPGTDPDEVAGRLEAGVARLRSGGATVVMFNGPDIGRTPVLGLLRGKVAIYNENLRTIAARHGVVVADMWSLRELVDPRMWAPDRLHFSPVGHQTIARMVLDTLGVAHGLEPFAADPLPPQTWRRARVEDLDWAREYFAPWVLRRLRGTSSGDGITPKRPEPGRVRPEG
ncbi:MAG: SGNH/GDSL hydrolase family protein [Actinomycetales bacterium]|nr:SGNH/GDSL hydrolase family protein [Actinomycetales bacterium]